MNEQAKVSVGSALLIIGALVILLLALPSLVSVPVSVAALAALAMAAGTLLVGTSHETV